MKQILSEIHGWKKYLIMHGTNLSQKICKFAEKNRVRKKERKKQNKIGTIKRK